MDSILVSQPSSALAVNINVLNDIQCFGDSVGTAEIIVSVEVYLLMFTMGKWDHI